MSSMKFFGLKAKKAAFLGLSALAFALSGCSSLAEPGDVKSRLVELNTRKHDYPSQELGAENRATVFQYALLDNRSFQPNVFTNRIEGLNDTASPTAGDSNSIGLVRMVSEPEERLPTDPSDPRTPVGVYLDIAGLKPIHAEAGAYEAFLLYNTHVPPVAPPRSNGQAQFGTITPEDAAVMRAMGSGNNTPGNVFTLDGNAPRFPSAQDHWPDRTSNVVTFPVNAGTFNSLRNGDAHAHWKFKPATNMVFPHQEFPFTGGVPPFYPPSGSFAAGQLGHTLSIVPGSGPLGVSNNDPRIYGDNPDDPRDPDRSEATNPAQREFRLRSVPSGLTEEIHRDVFLRRASFQPGVTNLQQRLYASVAKEIALVDKNADGVLTFEELDINGTSDGLPNTRLYFPITAFNRYVVQREINDGLIAPRFANSQRAWVLSGFLQQVGNQK
jgi:hypothetical protein